MTPLMVFTGYALLALAEAADSLSFLAQSSQQTSTVLPPMLTWMESPSSLQSHAAHVPVAMIPSLFSNAGYVLENCEQR
jgi:hypothetical protein